jgi:hypothetical protein
MRMLDDVRLTSGNGVEARVIEDGAVLVDLKSGKCFEVNRMGFEIWKLLVDGSTAAAVCEQLAARYDVDRQSLIGDIDRLLDRLLTEGLVVENR